MTSQTLREARKYEETAEKMIKKEERPDFHLSVRTGWLNDPNGFSYYRGEYHHTNQNGEACIGVMRSAKTSCIGNTFRRRLPRMRNMTKTGVFREARWCLSLIHI